MDEKLLAALAIDLDFISSRIEGLRSSLEDIRMRLHDKAVKLEELINQPQRPYRPQKKSKIKVKRH